MSESRIDRVLSVLKETANASQERNLRIDAHHPLAKCVLVFLDGVDVTMDCRWADRAAGEVALYERAANGRRRIIRDAEGRPEVSIVFRSGVVTYRRRPLADCAIRIWQSYSFVPRWWVRKSFGRLLDRLREARP